MATLRKGTVFVQSYPGCSNPITFEVLEIDREKDYLKVKCTRDGCSHEEEWQGEMDGLEFTEMAIDMGEYRIINDYLINKKAI